MNFVHIIQRVDLTAGVQVKDSVGDSGGFLSRDLREPRLRQPSPPPYTPRYVIIMKSCFDLIHLCEGPGAMVSPHMERQSMRK